MSLLATIAEWLQQIGWVRWLVQLPWHRIETLYIGEKIALGALIGVCFIAGVAATNRFMACQFSRPVKRETLKVPKRKKGFGIKHVVLILIALLPGGVVGMFTIYAIMGKSQWRRDALLICGLSVVPALVLSALRLDAFPWPHLQDAVYFSGALGLVFGLLQLWALIKLLREWWGEPDECVAWWPPLALWLQLLLLAGAALRILA